eukprot:scaffold763_cov202-Alexandrium_tamarense.AAC.4
MLVPLFRSERCRHAASDMQSQQLRVGDALPLLGTTFQLGFLLWSNTAHVFWTTTTKNRCHCGVMESLSIGIRQQAFNRCLSLHLLKPSAMPHRLCGVKINCRRYKPEPPKGLENWLVERNKYLRVEPERSCINFGQILCEVIERSVLQGLGEMLEL